MEKATKCDPILKVSKTRQLDYDLCELLQQMCKESNLYIEYKWIKGHQDVGKDGQRLFGLFPRAVQMKL